MASLHTKSGQRWSFEIVEYIWRHCLTMGDTHSRVGLYPIPDRVFVSCDSFGAESRRLLLNHRGAPTMLFELMQVDASGFYHTRFGAPAVDKSGNIGITVVGAALPWIKTMLARFTPIGLSAGSRDRVHPSRSQRAALVRATAWQSIFTPRWLTRR